MMMADFRKMNKDVLIGKCFDESIPLEERYESARELQRRGICRRRSPVPFSKKEKRKIVELYIDGCTISYIAIRFGRHVGTVKQFLKKKHKEGLPYRRRESVAD